MSRAGAAIALPGLDAYRGLERCLVAGVPGLLQVALGLIAGWWIYVPTHELLHAAGCLLGGGEVSVLEISGLYGGGLLARLFPFVVSGGEYAGRLSGFDTGGSDLVYLATDLAPYALTLFPGVWGLRAAAMARRPIAFGLCLPFALAPFLSLTGDAYEIGSVLVTRLPPWSAVAERNLLRGDDLFRIVTAVGEEGSPGRWAGVVAATVVGACWAWATYLCAGWIAARLGQDALPAGEVPSR